MKTVRFERLFDKRRYGVLTQDIAAEWDEDMSGTYVLASEAEAEIAELKDSGMSYHSCNKPDYHHRVKHLESQLAAAAERINELQKELDENRTTHSMNLAEKLRLSQKRERVLVEKYNELIYAVGNKYPNESRHETALRYIRNAEQSGNGQAQQAGAALAHKGGSQNEKGQINRRGNPLPGV